MGRSNNLRAVKPITAFNGPGDPPHSDPQTPQQIADNINHVIKAYKEDIDAVVELAEMNAKKIGRMGLGGDIAPGNQGRLAVFNAIIKERKGLGVTEVTAGEFKSYEDALAQYLRFGQSALENPDIRAEMQVGSEPDGGFTVVSDFDPQPRERLYRTSPMRAVASQINITSGSYEGLYEGDDIAHGWIGEQEDRDETASGSMAGFEIYARELYALIPLTQRLLDDSAIDIGAYVERRMARRFRRGENTAFVSGDGVKKPRGFLDYSAAAVLTADASRDWGVLQYVKTGANGGFPSYSGSSATDPGALYDIKAALNSELRADAIWAMNSGTFAVIEKMKDSDGRSLVRASLDVAIPERLLGYPVVIFEDMADVATNSFSIAFGNFDVGYQIVDKPGVRVLRDPFTTKGKVKFYGYKRVGGNVVDFDAIKLLKFAV